MKSLPVPTRVGLLTRTWLVATPLTRYAILFHGVATCHYHQSTRHSLLSITYNNRFGGQSTIQCLNPCLLSRRTDENLVNMRHEVRPRLLGHLHGCCLHRPILVVKQRTRDRDGHQPKFTFEKQDHILLVRQMGHWQDDNTGPGADAH